MATYESNGKQLAYPLTKMNCKQSCSGKDSGTCKTWKCNLKVWIHTGQRVQDMDSGMCQRGSW